MSSRRLPGTIAANLDWNDLFPCGQAFIRASVVSHVEVVISRGPRSHSKFDARLMEIVPNLDGFVSGLVEPIAALA
jgi:hypothetical protein